MITKPSLIVFIATLVILIVSAIIGNILQSNGTFGRLGPNAVCAVKAFYFTLFCILALSIIPLVLNYFISMQIKIGNADVFLIKWLQVHEKEVVFGFWAFCVIGLCIALPAVIKAGFFK